MKIFILGTSNSVVTDGYVKALRVNHTVTNYSLGRVSCIYHIKTILEKRMEIEDCDLLIVDHYINDINRYMKVFGIAHLSYCEDLYALLSSLNVNIVNIFFPILGLSDHKNNVSYKKLLELSKAINISTIDLNEIYDKPIFFKDKLHIKEELSFNFGVWLSSILIHRYWPKPAGGLLSYCSYSVIGSNKFSVISENKIEKYSNSLVNLLYLHINQDFMCKVEEPCSLVAIGYFKDKNDLSGLVINNEMVILSRDGYLVELLDYEIPCFESVKIKPFNASGSFYTLGKREYISGKFSGAKLVELIFKSKRTNKIVPAYREKIKLDFSGAF